MAVSMAVDGSVDGSRWQCRGLDKYVTDEKMGGGEGTSLSLAMDRVMVETKIARDLWGISMRGL